MKSQFVGAGNQTVPIHYSADINDPFGMGMVEAPKITEEDIFEIKNSRNFTCGNNKFQYGTT